LDGAIPQRSAPGGRAALFEGGCGLVAAMAGPDAGGPAVVAVAAGRTSHPIGVLAHVESGFFATP
jgi:hypothetical protein